MSTCAVYKGVTLLGTGSITGGSPTVSSYSSTNAENEERVNVVVTITSSTNIGASFCTRVLTDGGTSLTLKDNNPFTT